MAHSIRWTNRALGRLDEIADYIAQDSPERAKTFVTELRDRINVLQSHHLGTAGRVFGTKELVLHKHYIVVYRIKNDEVQILTLLHTAQK
ncbi:MAG: type II toxin-antitoxin system RelE/ParE family toxin [Gallionella sp.]|nr:type II toxin-antitoxin system RelE/ParE family toxin [Gallionella sp.]